MGYNTVVVVMNDALGSIERDPQFGKNLVDAIMKAVYGERENVRAGSHVNAATVIGSQHADVLQVAAIGGNYGRVVLSSSIADDTDEQILYALAAKLGFEVRKKPAKKVR